MSRSNVIDMGVILGPRNCCAQYIGSVYTDDNDTFDRFKLSGLSVSPAVALP